MMNGREKSCQKKESCGEYPLDKLPAERRKSESVGIARSIILRHHPATICNTPPMRRTTALRLLFRTHHEMKVRFQTSYRSVSARALGPSPPLES